MAYFSLTDLMFGDHGIANIPDISFADRALLLSRVARHFVEQGHHFGVSNDAISDQEISQAICEAKSEICGVEDKG